MENFKQKLTKKYLEQFDRYIQDVSSISFGKPDMPITQKSHIDIIVKYTDLLINKSSADLMDIYSSSVFAVNKHDSYSEKHILDTTDNLLEHKEILFQKGIASCFESLKKSAGKIYSEDAIKKCVAVNLATRLVIAKDDFENWAENVQAKENDFVAETEATNV